MPCMCGDICCSSCGPAQGNYRCELCGCWATDGCRHISIITGEYKKIYTKQLAAAREKERVRIESENAMWDRIEQGDYHETRSPTDPAH